MDSSSARATWLLAARDALHVAELAYNAGKYPVAALLCHWAVSHVLRGAFTSGRRRSRGIRAEAEELIEGFSEQCSDAQRALLTQLGAFVAAWSAAPAKAATLATNAQCREWLQDTARLIEAFLP